MENPPLEEHDHAHALPNEGQGQTSRQFKGIRLREWGKWVSEIRMPRSREKIYLGSYKTAEQAARAFDAASYCLRGPDAKFNFPDSVPPISSPSSLSRQQIQAVAAEYALNELPLPSISVQHNIDSKSEEKPSQSSSVSVTEFSSDDQKMSEELSFWKSLFSGSDDAEYLNLEKIPSIDEAWALEFWKSMFAGSDGAEYLNLENIPSIDEAWALELTPTLQDEEVDNSVDPTALWNFQDV